jgi:DNA replication protein DnaC
MEAAQIPVNYRQDTWQDFNLQKGNMRAVTLAQKAVKDGRSLYLWGNCGTGKTKLTSIIGNELMELVKKAECLIFDDLGASSRTEWSMGILQEIIDYRYTKALQTIITSNYSMNELKDYLVIIDKQGKAIENKQAGRISSRLEEMCHVAKLDTASFRHKPQEDF